MRTAWSCVREPVAGEARGIARADHVACVSATMSILERLRNWLLGRPALAPRADLSPSEQRAAAHDDDSQCAPVTFSLPRLPRAVAGPVVKRRRTDATYLVDLAAWSCTCPYAAARVTRYAELDVRRVCKHLSRLALNRTGVLSACDPPVAALLQRGVWSKKRRYSRVLETRFFVWSAWQSPVYLGITPRSPWVSVVTRRRRAGDVAPVFTGEYFLFAYNTEERAWAYDARPPGATVLRDLVSAMRQRGHLTAPIEPLLAPEDPETDEDDD